MILFAAGQSVNIPLWPDADVFLQFARAGFAAIEVAGSVGRDEFRSVPPGEAWIAVERFLEIDYEKEYEGWKMQVDWLKEQFASIDGLKAESIIPQSPNTVPTLVLTFKKGAFSKSGFDVQKALLDGDPSVAIARPREDGFNVTTWMLQPERLGTLAVRVREELLKARA